ncbi:MAG: hypothetical protein OHK0039_25290 [Bacteroidia bacterium]
MHQKHPSTHLWLAGALLFLAACRLNPLENLSWDAEVLTPIAYAEAGIFDVAGDSLFEADGDGLLALVYRDTVASERLADYVRFPDTSIRLSITLDTLDLSSDTIAQSITLREVAQQLADAGNAAGTLILANDGNTIPLLPATPGLSSGVIPIDGSDFFEYAKLDSGQLVLTIDNQFPVNLENVVFRIANTTLPGDPIVLDTFLLIGRYTSVTRIYNLAGKQIESQLEGELANLDIQAALFVPIDLDDFIEIRLVAQNLRAKTATAIFPAQTVLDTLRSTAYIFPGEFGEVQLTRLVVQSGRIQAETASTVEDTIRFRYALPGAVNAQGEIPSVDIFLDPAPPGGLITQTKIAELDGFTIDLSGGDLGFNTLQERITVDLLYSGNLVTLTRDDSVSVAFGLLDIVPTYVEGYIGQNTFTFSGTEAIDFFDDLDVERIHFAGATATVLFSSSIGVDTEVEVRAFSAVNTETNTQVRLAGTPLVAGPIVLRGPVLPDTFGTGYASVTFTPDNSNITRFINTLADELHYDLRVRTNFNGVPGQTSNFATGESQISGFVDFRLPLLGTVAGFSIRDTAETAWGSIDRPDELQRLTLSLLLENPFPVEVVMEATLLDDDRQALRSLFAPTVIPAGVPDSDGYVRTPGTATLSLPVEGSELEALLRDGAYVAYRFRFDTRPENSDVGFYTDYRIKARLVGQATYRIE